VSASHYQKFDELRLGRVRKARLICMSEAELHQ
jgi:hypothetical protein